MLFSYIQVSGAHRYCLSVAGRFRRQVEHYAGLVSLLYAISLCILFNYKYSPTRLKEHLDLVYRSLWQG